MEQKNIIFSAVALWCLMALSILAFIHVLIGGLHINPFHLPIRLDSLSTLVFMMVAILGVFIAHYSMSYLKGEARKDYFFKYLLLLVLSVSSFILSENLIILFFSWICISYSLHKLLLFYPNRFQAIKAAKKKHMVSRLGDLCLLIGIGLIGVVFKSFNLTTVFQATDEFLQNPFLPWAGVFLAMGAMVKSAQFPFHFWLPETMETPAVVSALMHAGVINAGGYLLIRMSPVIKNLEGVHVLLIVGGVWTAFYGAIVMATQNNIKKKLAYSTVSQMGVMMLLIGLGAYGLALFHLIAHSFYKAHAFLSTGTLISESKKAGLKWMGPRKTTIGVASILSFSLIVFGYMWFEGSYLALFVYGAILLLALFHNALNLSHVYNSDKVKGIFLIIFTLVFAMSLYIFLEFQTSSFLKGVIPTVYESSSTVSNLFSVVVFSFVLLLLGFYLTSSLQDPKTRFSKWLYVILWNNLYLGVLSDRFVSKFYRG